MGAESVNVGTKIDCRSDTCEARPSSNFNAKDRRDNMAKQYADREKNRKMRNLGELNLGEWLSAMILRDVKYYFVGPFRAGEPHNRWVDVAVDIGLSWLALCKNGILFLV
ncbi:hypothetical protein K439DRAFT_1625093 [Ramaria rubella]|nr:hypothetical protein K439DRAFT_1625093 [Ramaria rubella]